MQIENKSGRQRARGPEDEGSDDCFWTEIVVIAVTVVIQKNKSGRQRGRFPKMSAMTIVSGQGLSPSQ